MEKRENTHGVAILGTAHVHVGWYAGELRNSSWAVVKAVADENMERTQTMLGEEAQYIPDYTTDYREVLARDDIDTVCIASETSKHAELAVAAAEAGKHIVMEKVLSLSLADSDRIIEAAKKANVKIICPPFVHDVRPPISKAKQLLDAGEIGTPTAAHFHTGHEGLIYGKWEEWFYDPVLAGGGALVDLGVHPIYEALFLFGEASEVTGIFNTTFTERMLGDFPLSNITTDDNAIITVKFKNGVLCAIDTSHTRMGDRSNSAIYGTEGTIVMDDAAAPLAYLSTKVAGEGEWQTPELTEGPSTTELIADLIDTEENTWRVNGQWGRAVQEIVLAAYQSAETKRVVQLPL